MDKCFEVIADGVPAYKAATFGSKVFYATKQPEEDFEQRKIVQATTVEWIEVPNDLYIKDIIMSENKDYHDEEFELWVVIVTEKVGISVNRVSPYSQCTVCAKKHIVKAWNLFNEFTYTNDNLDVITGQLRLAADHLMWTYKETALLARELATIIEEVKFDEIEDKWERLLNMVRGNFLDEHPDVRERQKDLNLNKK